MSYVMRAIEVKDDQLVLGDAPRPEIGDNDVLIEMQAAGLNRADLIQRKGAYPPPPGASTILGLEVAGSVAAIGAKVTRWAVGDRVCALLAGGGYAEYTAVDEGSILPIPDDMSMVHAACLPEAMMTVWANVFQRAQLKQGEAFLCHGGTSGIGVMAIQMAKAAGAGAIYTTAGSAEKCELATNLGATRAINYREEDFVEIIRDLGNVDVTLDMVGGDYVQKNINVSRLNGRIVNIAYQNGFNVELNMAPVLMKRLSINATTLRARSVAEKRAIRDVIEAEYWPLVRSGEIKPVLDSVFKLGDAESAHAKMSAGGHSGKIILER